MSLNENNGAGNLYRIDSDGSVRKMIAGVTISNGLAWTKNKKNFYYIDTPTQEVVAYEFNAGTGNIKNKRSVIKIPKEDGSPDGMTIDSDDMLWIAHWVAGRYPLESINREKLLHISLPAAKLLPVLSGDFFRIFILLQQKLGWVKQNWGLNRLLVPFCGSELRIRRTSAIEYRCNI
jgi:sugar lactone lactonase YvrE